MSPKITSSKVSISIKSPPPSTGPEKWMYFKGNGHLSGRNGSYDHIPVQRFFYIPCIENGVDVFPWSRGFSLSWQIIPIRQAAYYTTFFYAASANTDFYDLSNKHGYVGCHPYAISAFPDPAGMDYTIHKWEISVDGVDHVSDFVNYGQILNQAFNCQVTNQTSGLSSLNFFTDIKSTANFSLLSREHSGVYAKATPHPQKALVFANCPWNAAHQHERLSGFIRRIKVFSGIMSDQDLIKESLSDQLVTTQGQQSIFWSKINPQNPDDLLSDHASPNSQRRQALWKDNFKCEIVSNVTAHPAYINAKLAPSEHLTHLERG
jgi:hypothetical protein